MSVSYAELVLVVLVLVIGKTLIDLVKLSRRLRETLASLESETRRADALQDDVRAAEVERLDAVKRSVEAELKLSEARLVNGALVDNNASLLREVRVLSDRLAEELERASARERADLDHARKAKQRARDLAEFDGYLTDIARAACWRAGLNNDEFSSDMDVSSMGKLNEVLVGMAQALQEKHPLRTIGDIIALWRG